MRVSGVGCCVVDLLYDLPPGPDRLGPWVSRATDDGGIIRGGAVLKSTFERRAGVPVEAWLSDVLRDVPARRSLGGVCVVSLIAAAQLLPPGAASVEFHACIADAPLGDWLLEQIARTPLGRAKLRRRAGRCPTTIILNERHADGTPERSFVTEPGTTEPLRLDPADLDRDFFESDVALFSCMQWEPRLFANLSAIVAASRRAGALTVMGTAFDPSYPTDRRWPLGDSDDVYRHLDVLVTDRTEALMYSGERTLAGARRFFQQKGAAALVVTDGLAPVYYWSSGAVCTPAEGEMPIPAAIVEDEATGALPTGDTVGCGDNFVGGVVASLALQRAPRGRVDLLDAVRLGNLSGALASTHAGGVFPERTPGEKRALVERYRAAYDAQLRRRA
jgi:sugar/nucleoside kinase (ribokinase family)